MPSSGASTWRGDKSVEQVLTETRPACPGETGTGPSWILPPEVLWPGGQSRRGQETGRQRPHRAHMSGPVAERKLWRLRRGAEEEKGGALDWRHRATGATGLAGLRGPQEPEATGAGTLQAWRAQSGVKAAPRCSGCRGADALGLPLRPGQRAECSREGQVFSCLPGAATPGVAGAGQSSGTGNPREESKPSGGVLSAPVRPRRPLPSGTGPSQDQLLAALAA